MITSILALSIILQVTAAILALRLIPISGRRSAWVLVACATALMAVRRGIGFYSTQLGQSPAGTERLIAELVALVISALMVIGIAQVKPIFVDQWTARKNLSWRVRQQAAVARLGQQALRGAQLSDLMQDAVSTVAKNLDVGLCKVLELQGDGESLLLKFGVGWKEGQLGRALVSAGVESQAGFTLARDEAVMTSDFAKETRFQVPPLLREHGVVSGVSVVIRGEERPYGVLGAHTTEPRVFSKHDLHFVEAIANVLAAAVERRKKELALQIREKRYRELFENALEIIYTHDLEGRMESMNPAGEEITGYSQDEITSLHIEELLAPEYRDVAMQFIRTALPSSGPTIQQFEILSKKGERIALEASLRLIFRDGRPAGVLGVGRDVSRRLELEEQLRQSQKLQAVGQLAGGIAHDFNNLLTVILGFSCQLGDLDAPPDARRAVDEISKAAMSAASLTRQLLAFSRRQILEPRVLDLNEVVREMERMLRRVIGEDIELGLVLEDDLDLVRADRGQLEQVIINLAVNARDAMPNGGRLLIQTNNEALEDRPLDDQPSLRPQTWVVLRVTDSGCGMDAETRDHIFEPFYTTKSVGKGTGLGLSMVYGIVEQSGGRIFVDTILGEGTTFKIALPRTADEPRSEPTGGTGKGEFVGTEVILLAEDDATVRRLVKDLLEEVGYRVIEARDGREAVEIFTREEEQIDLLISDVVMPNMGGAPLAQLLSHRRSGLRLMFMTGYSSGQSLVEELLEEGAGLLRKPFDRETLLKKVRETLDRPPRRT